MAKIEPTSETVAHHSRDRREEAARLRMLVPKNGRGTGRVKFVGRGKRNCLSVEFTITPRLQCRKDLPEAVREPARDASWSPSERRLEDWVR